jgi:hypothetical protein
MYYRTCYLKNLYASGGPWCVFHLAQQGDDGTVWTVHRSSTQVRDRTTSSPRYLGVRQDRGAPTPKIVAAACSGVSSGNSQSADQMTVTHQHVTPESSWRTERTGGTQTESCAPDPTTTIASSRRRYAAQTELHDPRVSTRHRPLLPWVELFGGTSGNRRSKSNCLTRRGRVLCLDQT